MSVILYLRKFELKSSLATLFCLSIRVEILLGPFSELNHSV